MEKEILDKITTGFKPTWYYVVIHKITGVVSVRKGSEIGQDQEAIEFGGKYYGTCSESGALDLLRNMFEDPDINVQEVLSNGRMREKLVNSIKIQ